MTWLIYNEHKTRIILVSPCSISAMVTNATFLTCHVVVVVTALKIRVCAKNV